MKKTMKQSLLITSLLAASFCVGGGVAAVNAAANETVAPVEFATTFGAEIRASAPNGIRFKLQLSEEKKAEIFKADSNKTLGMFIFLGSKTGELSETTTPSQKIDISFEESDLYQVGDYWYAHGVMTNLYVQNFNKQFIGVGYVATAGETTTYEYSDFDLTDNVRSMSYVAIEGYKVKPQAYLLDLIEKAVYAEYGVVETRKVEGEAVTYSFAKGEDKWISYEDMKADIPVTVSVAENDGELTIGETYDLNAALAIGTTKISGLDIPFTYETQSEEITLENGVVTAVADGEAEITVSFGDYSKTVTLNVSEKANMVFNPAATNAAEQVSYLQAAFNYGNVGGITQEFVSAEANDDTTYGGAYMRSVPTKTGVGRIKLTPKFTSSAYENYDVVNVWLYLKSNANDKVTVYFFNEPYFTQSVTPNQWTQVSLSRSRFMGNIDSPIDANSDWFCGTTYGTVTEIWLGEMVAEHAAANVVFDPAMGNSAQITYGQVAFNYGSTSPDVKVVSANDNAFETYKGAYFQVTPQKTGNGRIFVTPIHDVSTYAAYDAISFWFYVYSTANENLKLYFFDDASLTRTIATNQWVQVLFPTDTFIAKVGSQFLCAIPFSSTAKQVYIGEIVGMQADPSVVFDPDLPKSASQISIGTNNANLTMSFVAAGGAYSDEKYSGAYYQFKQNITTVNSNKWSKVLVTPRFNASAYADYDTVVAWVYLIAKDASYTMALAGGAHSEIITPNQWVAIEIPLKTFMENSAYFCDVKYANTAATATWGVDGLLIGEITAVKNA